MTPDNSAMASNSLQGARAAEHAEAGNRSSAINRRLRGFCCIRCGEGFPVMDLAEGCSSCLAEGYPASVVPQFDLLPPVRSGKGMPRFAERLPYPSFISLGEGDTPLVSVPRLAPELGLDSLMIKLEGANPTGSHKDRMSAQFMARAVDRGVKTVIAASSGNAGASLAAYAGANGIPCIIVTTSRMNPAWRAAIEASGATMLFVDNPLERWELVKEKVQAEGWMSATNYLDPPVGSEPFGVAGYRTLGYELAEDPASASADAIIVPTARGDLLWGIYQGFAELLAERVISQIPRLVAVEPFPRLERVLAGADHRGHFEGSSPLSSIGGVTVTYQAFEAVRRAQGAAVAVKADQVVADRSLLARHGHFLELSAAASLSALRVLNEREFEPLKNVVLIATSHGYKDVTN